MSLALVGAALFAVAAFAQTNRGSITGTVSDPVGAVVASANVVAVEAATHAQYTTVTTATGNYTLAEVPPGVYSLSVEVPGFKKFTQQGITVQVAVVDTIDVKLEVGRGHGVYHHHRRRAIAKDGKFRSELQYSDIDY